MLMVCLGNICRSPLAEGVLRRLAAERGIRLEVDSAGTADYHVGEAPDHRARACAKRHGIDIDGLRGRQVVPEDFHRSDHLLAMDQANLRDLLLLAPDPALAHKASLLMSHAPMGTTDEVPDPYYGPDSGFDHVYELVMEACHGFLDAIERKR